MSTALARRGRAWSSPAPRGLADAASAPEVTGHLAARTFVHAAGQRQFASPIVPLAQVRILVLSWHRESGGRAIGYVRVIRGHLDHASATTCWQTGVFAGDLALPQASGRFGALGATCDAWSAAALELHGLLCQQASKPCGVPGFPVLPPTLLAYPQEWQPMPQPTPMVLARAANDKTPWLLAWQQFYRERGVPAALCPPGMQLLDTRLCTRVAGYSRPGTPGRTAPQIYVDLREFAAGPDSAGLRPQVWWLPPGSAPAAAFAFGDLSLQADLWHTRPAWIAQLGLRTADRPATALAG